MSSLDNETPSSGTEQIISRKTLESELRPSVYNSVSRYLDKTPSAKIPNHENLRVGDIVLSRPLKNGHPKPHIVEDRQLAHDRDANSSYWTHASLYVGDLHIIESQIPKDTFAEKIKFWNWFNKPSVQVAPITKYSSTHDFLFLRYNSDRFSEFRGLIARYALLDLAVYARRYDLNSAIEAGAFENAQRRTTPNHEHTINCSEFILECYAIGGSALVSEYNDVLAGNTFFFPADFYTHSFFESVDIDYYKISD